MGTFWVHPLPPVRPVSRDGGQPRRDPGPGREGGRVEAPDWAEGTQLVDVLPSVAEGARSRWPGEGEYKRRAEPEGIQIEISSSASNAPRRGARREHVLDLLLFFTSLGLRTVGISRK